MITIRKCLPEDEKAAFPLARDFATSFLVDRAAYTVAFTQILATPDMYLAVAESEATVIGYVLGTVHPTFYAGGNVGWVEEVMVAEAYRKKGVGRMLMQDFETWAASKKCRLIALGTRRAAEFYRNIGYIESATYFRKIL